MQTHTAPSDRQQLLRLLLLLQGTIFFATGLESLLLGAPPMMIIPAMGTAATWWAARRASDPTRHFHRTIKIVERSVLVVAVLNTGLSVFLANQLLEPVAIVTQWVLPIVILRLTRTAVTPPPLPAMPVPAGEELTQPVKELQHV